MDNDNKIAWKKVLKILQEVRIPDPTYLKKLKQELKLSFEEFIHYDLESYSTLELLKKAEIIAQLIWFSMDTKKLQENLAKEFNIPFHRSKVEDTTKEFVEDLERIKAKTH